MDNRRAWPPDRPVTWLWATWTRSSSRRTWPARASLRLAVQRSGSRSMAAYARVSQAVSPGMWLSCWLTKPALRRTSRS